MAIRDVVAALYPLERELVSDGMDRALDLIGQHLPPEANYACETFAPGLPVWTWRVPERYVVHEAYVETDDGRRVIDYASNPLHVLSYSLPVDVKLTWEELAPHLHYTPLRSAADDVIPWEFAYYERTWGFCLTKQAFDRLPRNTTYRAVIRSEFITDPAKGLRVGVALVHPPGGIEPSAGEVVICTHTCHKRQANDDASGVGVAVELASRLVKKPLLPGGMSVRLLFCPETIGSIAYLSQHEELWPRLKGGMFIEMAGNQNTIALQRSRQGTHAIDRIAETVLQSGATPYRTGAFREVVCNDEMVINGPGINAPTISLSRWPYPEYHTSADNMDIIHEDMLVGVADVAEEIIRVFSSDYIPRRTFRGPIFLSRYGLWVDWRVNPKLNGALEQIMLQLEGARSVFEIAAAVGLSYWEVRAYIERLRAHGLVERLPIPRMPFDGVSQIASAASAVEAA